MRGAALAAAWLVALALTYALAPYIERANFVFFWVAVLFAAWYGGFAAAITAAIAAVVAVHLMVRSPGVGPGLPTVGELLTLGIFIGASGLVSALAAGRARVQREVRGHVRQLEEQAVELELQTDEARSLGDDLAEANARLERAAAVADAARREAEAARTRVAAILDGIADVVAAYDAEWRWTYLNPAARETLRAFGRDPDDAIGRVAWDVLPELRGTRFESETRRAAAEGRMIDFEEHQADIDRWFENRIVPGPNGTVTTFSRDVTDRHRALDAERAASDRARRLLAVTTGLSEAPAPEQVADVIFREGLSALGADAGSFALLHRRADAEPDDLGGAELEVVRAHGYSAPILAAFRRFPLHAGRPLSDAVLSGAPVLIASSAEWRARYPGGLADPADIGYEGFVAIPVLSGGRVLGGISASFSERLQLDEATRTFLASLGEQCGLALARAQSHEAEHRLRDFLSSILTSVGDGFVAFDSAFRYTYANPRAEEMLGHSAAELIGRVLWDVFPQATSSPFGAAFRRVHETRVAETVEAFWRRAETWIEARIFPASGGGLTTFFQDVSARHRAQSATVFLAEASGVLSASLDFETTLRVVAESAVPRLADWCAVDVVDEADAAQWPPRLLRLAIVHADPAQVALGSELMERYPTDWTAPGGMASVLRDHTPMFIPVLTDEMLVAGARDAEHLRMLRALHFSAIIVVPLVARGLTLGTLTLCMAESGRRYDDADLALARELALRAGVAVDNARLYRDGERARREAESANRAKSQFLSTMSHELRTPLNAIAGYTELLEMGLRGPTTQAQQEDLARIRRSSNVLMSLVNDVLNFARIEIGQVDFRLGTVRLDQAIADLEAVVMPQMRAKELIYHHEGCGDAVLVYADVDRLKQILANLLTNAIKFTAEGGDITLACRDDAAHERVEVAVRDTGRGIAPEQLGIIFEPFVQLDRHLTHDSQQGVGLGLAISRDLARAMGAELTVESTVGAGSTFTLSLPRPAEPGAG